MRILQLIWDLLVFYVQKLINGYFTFIFLGYIYDDWMDFVIVEQLGKLRTCNKISAFKDLYLRFLNFILRGNDCPQLDPFPRKNDNVVGGIYRY